MRTEGGKINLGQSRVGGHSVLQGVLPQSWGRWGGIRVALQGRKNNRPRVKRTKAQTWLQLLWSCGCSPSIDSILYPSLQFCDSLVIWGLDSSCRGWRTWLVWASSHLGTSGWFRAGQLFTVVSGDVCPLVLLALSAPPPLEWAGPCDSLLTHQEARVMGCHFWDHIHKRLCSALQEPPAAVFSHLMERLGGKEPRKAPGQQAVRDGGPPSSWGTDPCWWLPEQA